VAALGRPPGGGDSPHAYLVTLVTRLCLNELDSAKTRREESRSDRLPEPVDLDEGGIGLAGQIAEACFAGVLRQAGSRAWLSHEHFTVDGTLLEARASQKSFRPTDRPPAGDDDDPGNPTVSFRGERRSNATHRSATDPDARLAKKGAGKEAKLSYQASVLLDNRHGLVVATTVGAPSGTAEVDQAIELCATQPPEPGPTRPGTQRSKLDRITSRTSHRSTLFQQPASGAGSSSWGLRASRRPSRLTAPPTTEDCERRNPWWSLRQSTAWSR
jgi:hypothetical protein